MSKREELEKCNQAYKNALGRQLDNLKGDFNKVGKSALWIGGVLFATFFLVDTLTAKSKSKKSKAKKEATEPVAKPVKEDNMLMSAVKEQVIIFLLGLAAQRLSKFLNELKSEDEEENS